MNRLACRNFLRKMLPKIWIRDERGIGILELLLIIAVILVIAVMFRGWITDFLEGIFSDTESQYEQFRNPSDS